MLLETKPLLGKTIEVLAPSRQILTATLEFDKEKFFRAKTYLENLGAKILYTDAVTHAYYRFAGTDEERVSGFVNHDSNSIALALRGGFGATRVMSILSKIDDFKPFSLIGYSDTSAIQNWFGVNLGVRCVAGPTFSDFARVDERILENATQALVNAVNGPITLKFESKEKGNLTTSGLIWGGNLATVVALIGTKFLSIEKIANQDSIFFFEDVAEPAYRIERMLWTLIESGALKSAKAILIGDTTGANKPTLSSKDYSFNVTLDYLKERLPETPIITGLPFGHELTRGPVPIGTQVEITKNCYEVTLKEQKCQ